MRRFEYNEGASNKFWQIEVDGSDVVVEWGRIGTAGRAQTKSFPTQDKARAAADKLVAEKITKGYLEVGTTATASAQSRAARPPRPVAPTGPMSEDVFWQLIALFNWKRQGNDDAVLRPAVAALSRMSVEDIYAFDDILAAKLYALDTREICRETYRGEADPDDGEQYISADDFLYARCVIVANGRAVFERALARPRTVPQGLEFESLLYVARSAYEKKTGQEYDHLTPLSWESFGNEDGWKPTAETKPGWCTSEAVPPLNRRPG